MVLRPLLHPVIRVVPGALPVAQDQQELGPHLAGGTKTKQQEQGKVLWISCTETRLDVLSNRYSFLLPVLDIVLNGTEASLSKPNNDN